MSRSNKSTLVTSLAALSPRRTLRTLIPLSTSSRTALPICASRRTSKPLPSPSTSSRTAATEHIKQDGPEHVKQDGTTPDMRFKENKEEEEEPEHVKQDGTPDMRFKENQQAAAEPEHVKQDGTRQAGRQPGHALQGEQGGRGAAYHYCHFQHHHRP
eukprot:TRINITY_DN520_c0_g1_i25.p1 TRINITY_DN520_c0_g1~~TRINITY_DN520_c0_g1_i25.p1  ORF type:complete len:157 (-),score=25.14 TRINITY_DN520_c0_g1_i25:139-609(-)